jgi:hypothetical protein
VKQDDTTISGGPVTPSTTMLFNMGHGAMASQEILQPLESIANAQTGDVVFEIHPGYRAKFKGASHAVLRGVPRQYDPSEECIRWCEDHHYLPMDYLLKACHERSTANKLRITRNWYDSGAAPGTTANPQYQRWGMRLRVAMDAVLYGKTKSKNAQILADARTAALPDVQLKLIKTEIGAA